MTAWSLLAVPRPPEWRVDWEALVCRLAWLQTLDGVPQEPAYHAEGDVLTHTQMVASALAGMGAWRALPEGEREMLFAAALLHDIAKPARTRVEPDGSIISPGHAQAGAALAHYLLWTGAGLHEPPPFPWRLAVSRLVRFHGLPLWFYAKADPRRAMLVAAAATRLDHLALLAEADVRGRICADQQELLDRIAYFHAYSEEVGVAAGPYPFASDHSRFVYFSSHPETMPDPARAASDDTACEVMLLSGLPGTGKDSWIASHHPDWLVISLDAIRRELRISPTGGQGTVVQEARTQARDLLRRQQSFIWNATNISRNVRAQLITLFSAYHARVRIVYLDAPCATLLARNQARAHAVPAPVIHRLARHLEIPDATEAQNVEWVWK